MKEITACRPWLDAEVEAIKPKLIVALGATAAKALLGSSLSVTRRRGEVIAQEDGSAPPISATVHPSSILRAPDDETRKLEYKRFVEDLVSFARYLRD